MTEYTFYILQSKDKLIKPKYVGSSEDFIHRQSTHKYSCNNNSEKYNFKVYQFIRLNGGFENWEFVIIDKVNSCDWGTVFALGSTSYHLDHGKD